MLIAMRKGIVLAGGSGTRLYPLTKVVSKQLMPIYDKPMVYYPIATLMSAGIKDILIITTPEEQTLFKSLLSDGRDWGCHFDYVVQPSPDGLAQAFILAEDFLGQSNAALILGDNIFYGHDLLKVLNAASEKQTGGTIFGYHVSNPTAYGVVEFDNTNKVISIEEKPTIPKSNYAIPGIYFFDNNVVDVAKNVQPSSRGELEITDVIEHYLKIGTLNVEIMGRGSAWLDTGTHDSLLQAAQFIETLEKLQGLKVNCPEEVAYRMGYINKSQLRTLANPLRKSGYGEYLINLIEQQVFNEDY